MTAEMLLVILLLTATALAAGAFALILAAIGSAGWFVVLGCLVTVALAWRFVALRAEWGNEDLHDEWRAS